MVHVICEECWDQQNPGSATRAIPPITGVVCCRCGGGTSNPICIKVYGYKPACNYPAFGDRLRAVPALAHTS